MRGTALELIRELTSSDPEQQWELTEVKKKRSRDANSYFWVLVNKIAKKQRISDIEVHDRFLSENRVYYMNSGGGIDWKVSCEEPNQYGLIREYVGSECEYYINSGMVVSLQKDDGNVCKFKDGEDVKGTVYWHIQGTHQMNSKDMSRILSSVVYEAEQLGIEVLTPNEIAHLNALWAEKHG